MRTVSVFPEIRVCVKDCFFCCDRLYFSADIFGEGDMLRRLICNLKCFVKMVT